MALYISEDITSSLVSVEHWKTGDMEEERQKTCREPDELKVSTEPRGEHREKSLYCILLNIFIPSNDYNSSPPYFERLSWTQTSHLTLTQKHKCAGPTAAGTEMIPLWMQ